MQRKKTKIIDFNREGIINRNTKINCVGMNVQLSQEAKFLGIIMDSRLKFENQCQAISDKVKKANGIRNGILKYANKVTRGMDVNTTLIMYKSVIRSIINYGAPIYLDEDNYNNIQKIEKAQYLGLRTVLGYRNSSSTNVMIAEAKVTSIRNRARMLAKNCLMKIMVEENLVRRMEVEEWAKEERKKISPTPWRRKGILITAWEDVRKHKEDMCEGTRKQIYKMKYMQLTEEITVDVQTSKEEIKNKGKMNEIVMKIKQKHQIEEQAWEICIDGSKREEKEAIGSAFLIRNTAMGYRMSLNKRCNILTAEACAIAKSLEWVHNQNRNDDILILTDSMSTLKALQNNKIVTTTNHYILQIRKWYAKLKKTQEGKKRKKNSTRMDTGTPRINRKRRSG